MWIEWRKANLECLGRLQKWFLPVTRALAVHLKSILAHPSRTRTLWVKCLGLRSTVSPIHIPVASFFYSAGQQGPPLSLLWVTTRRENKSGYEWGHGPGRPTSHSYSHLPPIGRIYELIGPRPCPLAPEFFFSVMNHLPIILKLASFIN